jgi:hypothetical protein
VSSFSLIYGGGVLEYQVQTSFKQKHFIKNLEQYELQIRYFASPKR